MRLSSPRPIFAMKRAILAATICCAIAGVAIGAQTASPKKAATPVKKSPPAATPATKSARPAATTTAAGKAQKTATSTTRTPAKTGTRTTAARRYYGRRSYTAQQMSPSADRYREIQEALAAKGYLKTPPNGVWDKDSMDAMQRFQQDQKLDPTGKLTARSLSALGLGPKPADSAPASSPGTPASASAPAGGSSASSPAAAGAESNPLQ